MTRCENVTCSEVFLHFRQDLGTVRKGQVRTQKQDGFYVPTSHISTTAHHAPPLANHTNHPDRSQHGAAPFGLAAEEAVPLEGVRGSARPDASAGRASKRERNRRQMSHGGKSHDVALGRVDTSGGQHVASCMPLASPRVHYARQSHALSGGWGPVGTVRPCFWRPESFSFSATFQPVGARE